MIELKVNEKTLYFEVDEHLNERVDVFLTQRNPNYSRVRIQNLIKDGKVKIDGEVIKKASLVLNKKSVIEIIIPPIEPTSIKPEHIELDILYENNDLLVINKPAGLVVHPSAGHASGTLVNAILGYAPDIEGIGGELRPGIVHRLDKDTSGIILVAKNDLAHRWLQDQFRFRKVKKTYLALVDGFPPSSSGRVETAINRDTSLRKKMAIVSIGKGRDAISEYKVIEKFKSHSLLEFHPLTGRTHQIRLHCKFLGCPITGDKIYGHKRPTINIDRHFLHAINLQIILPGESEAREFVAPLPDELSELLSQLRMSTKDQLIP